MEVPFATTCLSRKKNSEQFYSEFQISKQNICIHLNIEFSKGHLYTVQTVSKSSQQQSEQACAVSRRNEQKNTQKYRGTLTISILNTIAYVAKLNSTPTWDPKISTDFECSLNVFLKNCKADMLLGTSHIHVTWYFLVLLCLVIAVLNKGPHLYKQVWLQSKALLLSS